MRTICLVIRKRSATIVLVFPSAHARMIRARWASAWPVFGRRAHCRSVSRSSSLKLREGIGRPALRFAWEIVRYLDSNGVIWSNGKVG